MRESLEHGFERVLFATRWLLAPVYAGLVVGLVLVVIKFFTELWELVTHFFVSGESHGEEAAAHDVTVALLSLVDIALLGNLLLIVIFAGYENFVSKLDASKDSADRPSWMGHVDFSGLKMKLIGSLVAISVILLLKDFVAAGDGKVLDYEAVAWRIGLHFTFVISGLLFAVMDYWGAKRLQLLAQMHSHEVADVVSEPFDMNAE